MTRTLTPLSRVAENSSRWPCFGVAARSRRTAGRKPRSAMWSASSSTVTSTAPRSQWPCWMRSSSRPGQATTMSTPRRSPCTCGCWPTPPKTVRVVSPAVAASGIRACSICPTSSRVGARIRARGLPGTTRPAGLGEPGDQGQQERVGLAGAGAAAAEDVPAGQRVEQRGGLDRGGRGDVARLEGGDEVVRVRRGRRRTGWSVRKTREITLDGGVSPEGSSVVARPPSQGGGWPGVRRERAALTSVAERPAGTRIAGG